MFHTIFYEPIYNLLVAILNIAPLHDVGIAIVGVTLIVKLILLPINISSLRMQHVMKKLEPEMSKIKEIQKKNPQEGTRLTMELYKKEKVNPFASLLGFIIQLPVIIALYFVCSRGLQYDASSLYSFITFPDTLHTYAFGLFDVTKRNIIIAILAGISSYVLARRQTSTMATEKKHPKDETFQDQFMKSMRLQILYVLPIIIVFTAAVFPSAIGLYWIVSNVINYGQDVYVKRKLAHLN
jgi:YidC/Oxa1 family membrane protein insertase